MKNKKISREFVGDIGLVLVICVSSLFTRHYPNIATKDIVISFLTFIILINMIYLIKLSVFKKSKDFVFAKNEKDIATKLDFFYWVMASVIIAIISIIVL